MNTKFKTIVAVVLITLSFSANATHHGLRPSHRITHPVHHHGGHPHCAGIVAATAVAAGVVIGSALTSKTTVMFKSQNTIWIPGYWLETKERFGRIISRTWIEGHYETR